MKSNAHIQALLDLEFLNIDYADLGDAAGLQNSAAAGNFVLAAHTAWPGRGGTQATNEATYTGYAVANIPRTAGGFTRTGNRITLAAERNVGTRTDAGAAQEISYFTLGLGNGGRAITRIIPANAISGTPPVAKPFSCLASDDIVRAVAHGLVLNDRVAFFDVEDAALPTTLTEGQLYHVISPNTDDFQVSTTQGGAAVNFTVGGSGKFQKMVPLSISQGNRPTLLVTTVIVDA